MTEQIIDSRSKVGKQLGLIDAIISVSKCAHDTIDGNNKHIQEALMDLSSTKELIYLMKLGESYIHECKKQENPYLCNQEV